MNNVVKLENYYFPSEMVGTTGIEPVTPAMSRQCSTAELRAPKKSNLASTHQGRARYHMRGALLNRYSFDSVVPDLIRDPFF